MKITKVDHIKTAVANDGQKGTTGILYVDPDRPGKIKDKEKHIEERVSAAKSLFAIFNPVKNRKAFRHNQIDLISFGNAGFKTALRNGRKDAPGFVADIKKTIDSRKGKCKYEFSANTEDIGKIMKQLRGIYSKSEYMNVISELLTVSLDIKDLKQCDNLQNETVWENFVSFIYEDYNREKVLKNVKKSLNNQNLVIQYDSEDGTFKPAIINAASSRKSREKEGLRRFLIMYADLDDSKRNELRIKLRRLVNLYFYGIDEVPRTEEVDVWAEHSNRRKIEKKYAEPIIIEKNGRFGPTKKLNIASTKDRIRQQNIKDYRRSMTVVNGEEKPLFFSDALINEFWIHHIESDVERLTSNIDIDKQYKLELGYLSEKVWKGIINYICTKYIAIGKALYHFGMRDLFSEQSEVDLGCILVDKAYGITSFDYEQIKAEENLQREMAVYVAFAVNNLATATVSLGEKNEDLLTMKEDSVRRVLKPNIRRNVLQFFGGMSEWNKEGSPFNGSEINDDRDINLLMNVKDALYAVRNESFHYHTMVPADSMKESKLIADMFDYDSVRASKIQRDKLYSNNLHMFYCADDIAHFAGNLYSKYAPRASQVPSFNRIFTRNGFEEYIRNELCIKSNLEPDNKDKWISSLYYVCKEIYYNGFLQSANLKRSFLDSVNRLTPRENQKGDEKAIENFKERIREIDSSDSEFSLAQICQIIMTEQNLQNGGNQRVRSAKTEKDSPAIYKHYKMLLFKALKNIFTQYIKSDEYSFLMTPKLQPEIAREDFLTELSVNMYSDLANMVKDKPILQNWYVLCRLLAPKQQNLLVGTFRHYIQYSEDIARRAKQTDNPLLENKNVDREYLLDVIRIIDMCIQISGITSNNVSDYFDSEDAFAEHILRYYDIGSEYADSDLSPAAKLRAYCNSELYEGQKAGLFYDGENPILNRNIILSKLYGADNLIYKIVDRVSTKDLVQYYRQSVKIDGYRKSDEPMNDVLQRNIKAYQEIKNKVELRDVVDYAEIANELQGQLINWSYLRERDFMYFQLGFHYNCLHNDDCEKPEDYRCLKADDKIINGAILYQIAAIHTYGLPVYVYKDGLCASKKANVQTSDKIKDFIEFTKGSAGVEDPGYYFDAGYELFGVLAEQDNVIKLRNYIDHFHYYAKQDRSLLDIYSEVFDRFFSYDMKYQKNVVNLMYNILLSHLVDVEFIFESDASKILKKSIGKNKDVVKDMATIRVSRKNGARSEMFTYRFSDGSSLEIPAKNKEYVRNIIKLIYYPDIDAVSEDMIRESDTKSNPSTKGGIVAKKGQDKFDKAGNPTKKTYKLNEERPSTSISDIIQGKYNNGDIVQGKVVYVDKKGRFVTIELSDKANKASFKPGDKKYKYGDIVKVCIKRYDINRKSYESTVIDQS